MIFCCCSFIYFPCFSLPSLCLIVVVFYNEKRPFVHPVCYETLNIEPDLHIIPMVTKVKHKCQIKFSGLSIFGVNTALQCDLLPLLIIAIFTLTFVNQINL